MADIRIEREHGMSLADARLVAVKWSERAKEKFDLQCDYQEGELSDEVSFSRSGVTGSLSITPERFELLAHLGFFLSAFKDKIETEIANNLDALIAKIPANNPDQTPAPKA